MCDVPPDSRVSWVSVEEISRLWGENFSSQRESKSEPAGFSPPVQRPFGAPRGAADRLLMEEGTAARERNFSRGCGFFGFRDSALAGSRFSRISQERCKALSLFKTQGAGNDLDSRARRRGRGAT